MATYLTEDFNSVPLGPNNNPDGWNLSFGNGVVFGFSQNGGGQYPVDNWYQFNGGNLFSPGIPFMPASITVFWGFNVGLGALTAGGIVINALNAAATGNIPLLTVRSEQNNSFSVIGFPNTQILYNTSNPPFPPPNPTFIYQQGIWCYAQLNVTFQSDPGGSGVVQVAYELAIDGISIASGTHLTGVLLSSIFAIGVWQVQFPGAITGFLGLSRIVVEDRVAVNTFPNPTVPLPESIEQMVLEYSSKPGDSSILISQALIEQASFPSIPSSVDISQMAIEVAYKVAPFGSGWIVQEA